MLKSRGGETIQYNICSTADYLMYLFVLDFVNIFLPALPPRNQSMLFGGSPRYENVPLIGRGSPPPSVRWPYTALVSQV